MFCEARVDLRAARINHASRDRFYDDYESMHCNPVDSCNWLTLEMVIKSPTTVKLDQIFGFSRSSASSVTRFGGLCITCRVRRRFRYAGEEER